MLQIVFNLLLCMLAGVAQAQSGVVASMQRSGVAPQALLDKLAALEAKVTTVGSALSAYTTTLQTNPNSCGTTTVYSGSCQSLPSTRRLLQISGTTTTNDGNMTAFGGLGNMITHVHGFLDNGSSGCSTSSGWSICTYDQIRQAHALRVSGYDPAVSFSGRFFPLDPGYIGISGVTPPNSSTATTTSCFLMTGNGAAPAYAPVMTFSGMTRTSQSYTACSSSTSMLCCRL